ncbi:MAG: O-antigen ligase family protein [Devosia sp.]|nr:O-antigen ligase family protein [Devosia sp.]
MASTPDFETLLRRTLLALVLVLPCLFGFITTYLLLLVALVGLVWLLLPGQRAQGALQLDRAGKLLLAGFLGLAAVIAIDALVAGRPRDLLYALDFGMLALYAPLASLLRRGAGPRNAAIVADLALAGTAIALVVAVAEELVYHPDRAGFIGNDPIRFGDTALILGFLALSGVVAHKGARRWLYLLGPLFAVLVDLMSGARSALVVFPLLTVLAVILLVQRRAVAAAIGGGAVVLFGGAVGIALLLHNSRVASVIEIARAMLGGGTVADEATRERLVLYRAGWSAFQQAPWLGVGWHERMQAITPLLPDADRALGGLPHLHNEMLNFAVGAGIAGVLIYLLLLAAPIMGLLTSPPDGQRRVQRYGVALLLASYVALGLADVMLGFETHTALYVAWAAVLLGYCRDDAENDRPGHAAVSPRP